MIAAEHLLKVGAELGEGPVWIDGCLWFVDIKSNQIFRHDPVTVRTNSWNAPEHVGWVLPSHRGDLIAGLKSGPHRFSPCDGTFELIAQVDAHIPANRLNDAAIDCAGRLYFGTMDDNERKAMGRLFVLDQGAIRAVDVPVVVITNGPAIAPSGDRLYHVDTLGKLVWAHPTAADGAALPGTVFLRFDDDQGYPDGAICDAEGGLWICFYGGWAARRYDADGHQTHEVRFPVANVTKLSLGGSDGRTAYATTARQGLSPKELAEQPSAGDLFTFRVEFPAMRQVAANS
jgi:D-xylonolactonase